MTYLFDPSRAPVMKALSLWQPWATLVARGLKLHETRHWSTEHRGLLAIHAAKRLDLAGAPEALCRATLGADWWDACPLGAVVAVARLRRCHRADDVADTVTRADLAAGNFTPGRFAWELTDVRALGEPIPLAGRQGLFNWTPPEDLADRLGPALDHAAAVAAIGWGEKAEERVRAALLRCTHHPDRTSRVNLDGDELCQECADAWARGEGDNAAYLAEQSATGVDHGY